MLYPSFLTTRGGASNECAGKQTKHGSYPCQAPFPSAKPPPRVVVWQVWSVNNQPPDDPFPARVIPAAARPSPPPGQSWGPALMVGLVSVWRGLLAAWLGYACTAWRGLPGPGLHLPRVGRAGVCCQPCRVAFCCYINVMSLLSFFLFSCKTCSPLEWVLIKQQRSKYWIVLSMSEGNNQ